MRPGIHPWHDISPGLYAPKIVNMIVECPKESKVKYEIDKETGLLKLDRYLYSAVHYPGDYGFIPQTLWEDGDAMDIMVITNAPAYPMTLCEVKVIGVVAMEDSKEQDNKIIGVHANDPRFSEWNSIHDIPQHFLRELQHFLETYKELQGKKTKVYEILGPQEAYADIKKSMANYKKAFADNKSKNKR